MLGAIIGDIVGSRFEWNNHKFKDFELFTRDCHFTDDSIMTLAVAQAIVQNGKDMKRLSDTIASTLQSVGRPYPGSGYGGMFYNWMYSDNPRPYNSYGNGAAMRVSPCGFAASSLDDAKELSRRVTEVTHNHPEGLKGAEATAVAVYLARTGISLAEIGSHIDSNYYPMNFTLDEIRPSYRFNETCQETVPQAIKAFLESRNFEDAIRNAISLGGDSDTMAAITGGIAEAYYGVPADIRTQAVEYLDDKLKSILTRFERVYPPAAGKR
jgi:type I restriction enzyme M protein